jgi:hypothetical protein
MVNLTYIQAQELFDSKESEQLADLGYLLDGLSEADRKVAERLIRDVGVERFVRIFKGIKRIGRGRTKVVAEYQLFEAAHLMMSDAALTAGQAANRTARRVVMEADWRGQRVIDEASLSNRIERELKRRGPRIERAGAKNRAAENETREMIAGFIRDRDGRRTRA